MREIRFFFNDADWTLFSDTWEDEIVNAVEKRESDKAVHALWTDVALMKLFWRSELVVSHSKFQGVVYE